jgi:pilus assembly protein Flp/PilA
MRLLGLSDASGMKDNAIRAMLLDDTAQGLVEYALIIALVSIVAIAALRFLGSKASNTLNNAANALAN